MGDKMTPIMTFYTSILVGVLYAGLVLAGLPVTIWDKPGAYLLALAILAGSVASWWAVLRYIERVSK